MARGPAKAAPSTWPPAFSAPRCSAASWAGLRLASCREAVLGRPGGLGMPASGRAPRRRRSPRAWASLRECLERRQMLRHAVSYTVPSGLPAGPPPPCLLQPAPFTACSCMGARMGSAHTGQGPPGT